MGVGGKRKVFVPDLRSLRWEIEKKIPSGVCPGWELDHHLTLLLHVLGERDLLAIKLLFERESGLGCIVRPARTNRVRPISLSSRVEGEGRKEKVRMANQGNSAETHRLKLRSSVWRRRDGGRCLISFLFPVLYKRMQPPSPVPHPLIHLSPPSSLSKYKSFLRHTLVLSVQSCQEEQSSPVRALAPTRPGTSGLVFSLCVLSLSLQPTLHVLTIVHPV